MAPQITHMSGVSSSPSAASTSAPLSMSRSASCERFSLQARTSSSPLARAAAGPSAARSSLGSTPSSAAFCASDAASAPTAGSGGSTGTRMARSTAQCEAWLAASAARHCAPQ